MLTLDDSLASANQWKALNIYVSQLFMKLYSRGGKKVFELFGCNFKIVGMVYSNFISI